ncbi:DUF3159 domain-containing protein [Kocuria sp.]|uniref:DUF3159 domain-containing protein n=1 Tax=Kocuria sp. TaxID=1871328 RepID=UPI0026DF8CF8|nr:DUF3159 domain-containing protein [Kocuria sp.]MDO5619360.1 DUF3159 domain-containing protein [Kocuria sp.]
MTQDSNHDSQAADAATTYAQRSGMRRNAAGQLDVMHAIGGWRGLIEALLPGALFLVVLIVTGQLRTALVAALAVAGLFTVVRLIQQQTLVQAVSGLVGVGICALFANTTGEARDYYTPGFFINAGYGLALLISIVARWPILGVVFGYIRGEGTAWRQDPIRMKAYRLATWFVVAMFAARLAVQLPLYLADDVAALGIARLVMGVPLYAMVLWLAWMVSRPIQRANNS